MNLHEIYKTLMRRGMPEHQALRPASMVGNCWRLDGPSSTAFIDWDDPVAYDLITMHALRWWMTMRSKNSMWIGQKQIHARQVRTGNRKVGISYVDEVNGGPWILAAILAATEHLEPKGDDDAKRP